MSIKRFLCSRLLHLLGWTIGSRGYDVQKSVICVAPHTSNRDFLIGKLFYNAIGKNAKFLMKREWFVFPLNLIFKSMGGISVDRGQSSSTTEVLAEEYSKHDSFHIAITPEGTRKKTTEWKRGFYYIALKAGVPIQVAYIDYGKKVVGFKALFYPTGNVDEDIQKIRSMYNDVSGYHKENF